MTTQENIGIVNDYFTAAGHPNVGDERAGSAKRVASAAGEGSVVVPGIYEFLGDPSPGLEPTSSHVAPTINASEVA
jgi:hypothetical protein